MATSQQYSLRWNNYLRHITYAFDSLRLNDEFVDVTLWCDGQKIKAHKVLLSACSGYFKEIFKDNPHPHPVIIFKFIKFEDLNSIIEFMYQGEVNVHQEALQSFLQTAELLAVQGLTSEEKEKPKTTRIQSEDQIIKTIPSTIRTVTENVTQASQTIEIPTTAIVTQHTNQQAAQHITHQQAQQQQQSSQQTTSPSSGIKKRKITFSDDDDNIYTTESVDYIKEEGTIVKATEMTYLPATVKMDIPEYIDVSDGTHLNDSVTQTHQSPQEAGGQTVTQYTSEYEILTESEVDEKFQAEAGDGEITTIEMGRLITQPTSTDSGGKDDKGNTIIPEQSLQCKVCKRKLQSMSALRRHVASKHSYTSKKHDCSMCNKSFKTKWSLATHNSRFHRMARPAKLCIKMEHM